jgi:hypothetical protein
MTQEDFLNIAQLNPDTLNVWFTDTNDILGLTIPVLTLASPPDNILNILQQVQTITLPLNATNSVVLHVLTRSMQSVIVAGVEKQYYFFTVTPIHVGTADTVISNGQIVLEPGYTGLSFQASGYNVLQGSIENQRASSYIMIAEEGNRSLQYPLLPGNIDALQANTAERAYVQDSNYSITGWTKGRYNGTKTDKYNYGTIDPAITGKVFNGSYFATNVTDGMIQSQSSTDIVYENYFYSSIQDIPTPTLRFSGFVLYTAITTVQQTNIDLYTTTANTSSYQINPGDLIAVTDGTYIGNYGYGSNYEVMQVVTVTPLPITVPNEYRINLTVNRGWNGTVPDTYTVSNDIMKLDPTRIFKINGSKIEVGERGKYKVKETGEILYVDKLGTLMQSNVGIKRI